MSARERQALRHGGLEGQGVSGNLQGLFQAVLKRLAVIFALVPHPGREGGGRVELLVGLGCQGGGSSPRSSGGTAVTTNREIPLLSGI